MSMDEVSCGHLCGSDGGDKVPLLVRVSQVSKELFGQILDYRAHQIAISATH